MIPTNNERTYTLWPNRKMATALCIAGIYLLFIPGTDTNSYGLKCYNNGIVVMDNHTYRCECSVQFTGLVCETELLPSKWPNGPYALLMPASGCPESTNHGWGTGYIRFTTTSKLDIWTEKYNSSGEVQRMAVLDDPTELAGTFKSFSFELIFCFKQETRSGRNTTAWSDLNITVLGDRKGCPSGFSEEIDYLPLPPIQSWQADGYLPYYEIRHGEDNRTQFVTKHCHLNSASETMSVRYDNPFISVKAYADRCPSSLEEYDVEEETVQLGYIYGTFTLQTQLTNLSFCIYRPKEENLYHSNWPNGPCAVLMLNTGCPEPLEHGWEVGYLQFQTLRYDTDSDSIEFNECKDIMCLGRLLKLYHSSGSQMFFCSKREQSDTNNDVDWPQGKYSIFSTDKGCPRGFVQYFERIVFDYGDSILKRGTLPYAKVTYLEYGAKPTFELELMMCGISDTGTGLQPSWITPFSFFAPERQSCHDWNGIYHTQSSRILGMQLCIYVPVETNTEECTGLDFQCKDGRCIRFAHRCDNDKDCDDREDEEDCTYSCYNGQFSCVRGRNCSDGPVDVRYHCEQKKQKDCYGYEFKCGSKDCVKKRFICDGIKDCEDGSDERFDNCDIRCTRNTFYCRHSRKCISKRRLCDGSVDCEDGGDENESVCPSICQPSGIYMGRNFRRNVQRPVCMSVEEGTQSETAWGIGEFCRNRNRCQRVKELCDELLSMDGQIQGRSKPFVIEKTTSCHRGLGLQDGHIKDHQLYATRSIEGHSANMIRPSKSSWCPVSHETTPYLKVNFGRITIVSGVVMYNRVESRGTTVNGSFIPEVIPIGCRSFSVRYSVYSYSYNRYPTEIFQIDQSKDIDEPQTILFLRPFLATTVLIYPLEAILDGQLCLRLELLGCSSLRYTGHWGDHISFNKLSEEFSFTKLYGRRVDMTQTLSDRIYKWTIKVSGDGYVRLEAWWIQLYNHSIQIGGCPYDVISFDDLFEPITAQHNGQRMSYPTDKQRVVLTFISCMRQDDRISRFQIGVFKDDIPTIWGQIKDITILEGRLITTSLLGLFVNVPKKHIWNLDSMVYRRPLLFSIQTFNIPCNTGKNSYLIITNNRVKQKATDIAERFYVTLEVDGETTTYLADASLVEMMNSEEYKFTISNGLYTEDGLCNTGRRPRKAYREWRLRIVFTYSDRVSSHSPEGFSAVFKIEQIAELHKYFERYEGYESSEQVGQFGTYSVHSKKWRKHYRFRHQVTFVDWNTQAQLCHVENYHLPVVHTREEMEFIQSWLVYRMADHFTTHKARTSRYSWSRDGFQWSPHLNIYIHIGLLRYTGINGIKDIWQDGTSLSYTAWDTVEPKNTTVNRCTGMMINMTTGEARWLSRLCKESRIMNPDFMVASLCEKSSGITPSGINVSIIGEEHFQTNISTVHSARLKRCNSTEWLSPLAICDGVHDCHDWSDETDCPGVKNETCPEDMYKCKRGECIHIGLVCNFMFDCPDKTDEDCVMPPCVDQEHRCANNQCIPAHQRCNAVQDCLDGSDETFCLSCNGAFSCGDLTCIHESLICDNVPDCANGRDETNCDKDIRTCFDLWKAGYDEHGTIDRSGEYIECHYNVTKETLLTTTSIDVKRGWTSLGENNEMRRLENTDFVGFGDSCFLQVHGVVILCRFLRECFNNSIQNRFEIKIDNGSFVGEDVERADIVIRVRKEYVDILRTKYRDHRNRLMIEIQPAQCSSELPGIDQFLRCGDGKSVPASRKCLYEINLAGVIDGCRNFKHLQNCDNVSCPEGYYKCPSSFCLAKRYVCDGERQCPGGEDENGCWCDGNSYAIVVIYSDTVNRSTELYIHQFARQLYSENANVDIVRYTFDIDTRNFTVKKSPLHPYNEDLYLGESETFTAVKDELYVEITESYKDWNSVTMINIEQYQWHHFKGDFQNSTIIDKVFEITIDPNIMQRVNTVTTARGSNLIFRSWKVLASFGAALFPDLCKVNVVNSCENQFRCSSSKICLPLDQICDGTTHCPFGDDEMMCDFQCHRKCSCGLYRANCRSVDLTNQHFVEIDSTVRVLDISDNKIFLNGTLVIPKPFPYLIKFLAIHCGIVSVKAETFLKAANIKHLDLSFNNIKIITTRMLYGLKHLEVLELNGNDYIERIQPRSFEMLSRLSALSITNTKISEIQPYTFYKLNVKTLNISNNKIRKIHMNSFAELSAENIDFSENDINEFDSEIFKKTANLKTIRSPAYKFCCIKPESIPDEDCWPHQDEFSSCEDLMRNQILQTLVWVLGAAALIANTSTIFYRLFYDRKCLQKGFGMFVTNLAASDLLMGIYMIIIAIADITFRNRYIMMDDYWRHSAWCNLAGVLATVSSEASVLFMCLITVDRILVIKYPFGQWRFGSKSSKVATITSWIFSWIIALIPILIEDYFEGQFYSTSGVCLALPLTHRRPPGWLYSFLVYVAFNFIAFIMIAIGQLVIYLEIRKTSERMKKVRSQRRNDVRIAKNLLLVLSTDFLCWFPVGVMGIMAARGHVIPGETYAWTAVFIVPINAALNPFLYTLSAVLRQKTSSVTSNTKEETMSKDFKVQCNLGVDSNVECNVDVDSKSHRNLDVAKPATLDSPKGSAYLTFDQLPAKQIILNPKAVLSAYLALVRTMVGLHKTDLVYGGVSIGHFMYCTDSGKIQMFHPEPRRCSSKDDKDNDVHTAGRVLEHLLKFTKPSD